MVKISTLVVLISLVCQVSAQELRKPMQEVYESFRALQLYLLDDQSFSDPRNRATIEKSLDSLSSNFHQIEEVGPKYRSKPGFVSQLKVVNEILDDSLRRFKEERPGYAYWRVKAVANHCIACHTTYSVNWHFEDPRDSLEKINLYQRGEFFLASRQFDKAEKSYVATLGDPSLRHLRMEALRRWLLINTRVNTDPEVASKQLNKFLKQFDFSNYEREEIEGWIASFKRWQKESTTARNPLEKAETLLKHAVSSEDPLQPQVKTVELLRATALLHDVLAKGDLNGVERGQALYLLGLGYSRLPLFRINELPDLYLLQCIDQFPGTQNAKRSFELYKELVILGFTGSGGTHVPADKQLELKELYNRAYGVARFDEKV